MATPRSSLEAAALAAAQAAIPASVALVYLLPDEGLSAEVLRDIVLRSVTVEAFRRSKMGVSWEGRAEFQVMVDPFATDGGATCRELMTTLETTFETPLSLTGFTVDEQLVEQSAFSSESLAGPGGEELHEGRIVLFFEIT